MAVDGGLLVEKCREWGDNYLIYNNIYIVLRANTPFRPHPSCLGKINKGIREYKSPTPVKLYIHFTFIEDLQ